LNINSISCVPPFIIEAGREALENSALIEPEVQKMVASFEKRRNFVVETLNLIPGVHCSQPGGAFYAFPNIAGVVEALGILDDYQKLPQERRKKTSPSTLFQRFALFQHGVALMDRKSFGAIGSEDQHFLRFSTATKQEWLEEGLKRFKSACHDGKGWKRFFQGGQGSLL
jgi:aspartate aminotransferase